MNLLIMIALAVIVLIFILLFTNIGADYTKKTDQNLLALWPLHERNIRAARAAGPTAYQKAIEKSSALTNELKRRGLLASDFTFEDSLLDSIAKEKFSKSLDELRKLANANNPTALYQLGMLFHSIKERDTSIQYVSKAANLGDLDAQYALGWAFITEGSGVVPSKVTALKWFMIAADRGHTEAGRTLGVAQKSCTSQETHAARSQADEWAAQ